MKYLFGLLLLVCSVAVLGQNEMARPDVPGDVMVDIGLNYLDEEPIFVNQAGWRSKSLGVYYLRRKPISEKFSFYYGAGFGFEKISLGDTVTLSSGYVNDANPNNIFVEPVAITSLPSGIQFDKNRLAVTYFDVPLDLRFHPRGTQDGEGLFVGVGGILGLRLNSHSKLKFDEGGETVIEKVKGEYNLNGVRYGVQARFGFRGVHIFYKQYFSDLFQDSVGAANPRMTTIGINVTGF